MSRENDRVPTLADDRMNSLTMSPQKKDKAVSLTRLKKGQVMRVHSLPVGTLRAQLIRLGLNEGAIVVCFERLPGGTIVLQKNRQLIAIGHALAKEILVVFQNGRE